MRIICIFLNKFLRLHCVLSFLTREPYYSLLRQHLEFLYLFIKKFMNFMNLIFSNLKKLEKLEIVIFLKNQKTNKMHR